MSHSPTRHQLNGLSRAIIDAETKRVAQFDASLVASAKRIVSAWNFRIAANIEAVRCGDRHSDAGAEFWPTIGTAIASEHHMLRYSCPACQQIGELDLRELVDAHHPRAPLSVLIPKVSCKACCPNPPLAILLELVTPAHEAHFGSVMLEDFPEGLVRLICARCNRQGQYRKTTLLRRYGPRVTGPDLLRQIAKCDRQNNASRPCGAHFDR